jgi:hypothetical protein
MSQRYGPLVNAVATRGARPGCAAVIKLGKRGVELDLRLPRDTAPFIPPPVAAPTIVAHPVSPAYGYAPMAAVAPMPAKPKSGVRAGWIAAAVVGVALVGAVISNSGKENPSTENLAVVATTTSSAAAATTTTTTTTTTTVAPTTTTVTTTVPPTTTVVPQVNAAPTTTVPQKRTTTTKPQAAAPQTTTKPQGGGGCHPSYSPCVPVAADVDCAGGKGNGPVYVSGPITVVGPDVYGLDSDKDGIACE